MEIKIDELNDLSYEENLSFKEKVKKSNHHLKQKIKSIFKKDTWKNIGATIKYYTLKFGRSCKYIFKQLGKKSTYIKIWNSIKKITKIFFSNKKATVGTIIMLFFLFLAIFGRMIFPYDAVTDEANKYLGPSWEHWLGTDNLGRDNFRQIVYGARDVMVIAVLTSIITVFIGIVLGMSSGLIGGKYDAFINLITNLFLSIPSFPILLILASFFTIEDSLTFALVLSMFNWAGLSRAIRSQIVSLRERDYIQICKVMNLSKTHIVFNELLPNIASYILINFILIMRNAITGSVGIMLLGLAAFQPTNWGAILLRVKDAGALLIPEAIWFVFSPIIAIMIFQTGVILLSSGLDETLNPRLRKN